VSNNAENTINERLKILIQALGITPAALSKILGASDSTVRNYIYRDTKPGYEVLEKLYRSFRHINLPWLFGEPGEPLLTDAGEAAGAVSNNRKFSRSLIVGHQSGGTATQNQGTSASEQAAMQRELEFLRSQVADRERTIADKERTIQILLNKL
jgi:transcriptional regulator with XRE-family HTH domain